MRIPNTDNCDTFDLLMLLVEFLVVPDELLHEVVDLHQGGVMHLHKVKRKILLF
jgi:hypothetical protein